jgi:beta,beta-carotene 9',10'-dioxygenase
MPDKLFKLGFDRNQEPVSRTALQPQGEIPAWLDGTFMRNGPGLFYVGEQRLNHWFDGLAMLHKFDFEHGQVQYQSSFLECEASRQALNNDHLTYAEFATDPCWGLFGRMRSMFRYGPTDSAKVNLAQVGEHYFALGETTMQIEFDLETLESIGRYNFNQPRFGTSSTAHPHFDGGGAFNLITRYGPINSYQVRKMDREATKVAAVNTLTPSYMHSFGMSEKYYVIAESPFTVRSIRLMMANKPFIENFKWHKRRGTKIWVIDRDTAKVVISKEVEPFFFFHFVNTFDTEAGVVFDIVTYEDASVIQSYYLENISDPASRIPGGTLKRFALDTRSGDVHVRDLSDAQIELPHIDYRRYHMREDYRYVYAMGLSGEQAKFYDEIVKIDITGATTMRWTEAGCYPGEPIFVPKPGGAGQDDGVILTLVLDTLNKSSFLLVLNAGNFDEIARVPAPEPILFGFHGSYFKREVA